MTVKMIKVKLKSRIKCHYCLLYNAKLSLIEEVFRDLYHAGCFICAGQLAG